ncbi:hypothetical protein HYU95_00375 [Candidatus Daviesbacteria bacterium]|nr:hypothetical protein [Candidatus Daviesbacteria bacterium]
MDGIKGSFCQIDLGITGHELLTTNLHEDFKLPDNIKELQCTQPPEDIIFAEVYVEFKEPIQGINGNNFLYVLYKNQLLQENNKSGSSVQYPGAPSSFSGSIFNGGEEGNREVPGNPELSGDPKWIKYIRVGNLIEIDDSLTDGFQPIVDSGYLMHFDENGKRKNFLFVYQGKVFKLIRAEKRASEALLVDYSNQSNESSNSAQPSTLLKEQGYLNTYIDPEYYYIVKYPSNLTDTNTSPEKGFALFTDGNSDPSIPRVFSLTTTKNDIKFDDPKELFGKRGNIKYSSDTIQNNTVQKISVGKDTAYVMENVSSGINRDEIILHGDILVNIQTYDEGDKLKAVLDQILSSFRFAD